MNDILNTILNALQNIDFGNQHTVFGIVFAGLIAGAIRYFEKKKLKADATPAEQPTVTTSGTGGGILKFIFGLFKKKQ